MSATVQTQQVEHGSDPSPEEILAQCRRIRGSWSDATRRQRAGEIVRWVLPETRDPSLHSAIGSSR
ncbi:MAG: hypothetical protein KF861_14380 [Planctomycetaceae bacterium]|nr:hypothetical protein [Planctomycetaceae bacterium]